MSQYNYVIGRTGQYPICGCQDGSKHSRKISELVFPSLVMYLSVECIFMSIPLAHGSNVYFFLESY